jgi:hypothetical protein
LIPRIHLYVMFYFYFLQDGGQVDGLKALSGLARGPPSDDGGTRLLRLLEVEVRLGVTVPSRVSRDDEGAVAKPLVDVVGPESRGIIGEDDGVRGPSSIVYGEEGALREILDCGWGNRSDEDSRDGSGPVRNCFHISQISIRACSEILGAEIWHETRLTGEVEGVPHAGGDTRANIQVAVSVPGTVGVDLAGNSSVDASDNTELLGARSPGEHGSSACDLAGEGTHHG